MALSFRPLLALPALLAAPLAAQDKAPETLAQRFKATSPAVEKLMKERQAKEALAKAEALLPATKPAFDKSTPATGLASSAEYSALMAAYSLTGKAALMDGRWEEALVHFQKAEETAKENASETALALAPSIEGWKTAIANGKKALEEGSARRAELKAKANKDERETAELKNFEIFENNVRVGPIQLAKIQGSLDGLKSDSEGFAKAIDGIKKSLEEEQNNLTKFKNDKPKYVVAVFSPANMSLRGTTGDKLDFLARLVYLDPKNAKVQREIDKLMGKPVAEEKGASKGKSKKKSK